MSSGDLWYWLGWLMVAVVNTALIYAAWWALFADKAKGRRRCPRCWYDLAYATGMMCPECGHNARDEREFGRTRRRYVIAVLSITACVAIAAFVNDRVNHRGWSSIFPTKVLIVATPLFGDAKSAIHREMVKRSNGDRLSDREWAMLMERCAKGDWRHEPASREWSAKYGPFVVRRRRLIEFYEDLEWDPDIERLLSEMPPRVDVAARETWPVDEVPFQMWLNLREWWPGEWDCRITATPRIDAVEPISILRRSTRYRVSSGYTVPMPHLNPEREQLELEVSVDRRRVGTTTWETVHSTSVMLQTEFADTLTDFIEPTSSEIMDAAVRQTFGGGVVKYTDGPSPVRVYFHPQTTYSGEFNDVAIGAQIELLQDGESRRILDIWWLGGSSVDERGVGWQASGEDPPALSEVNSRDGRWQMRVSGRPELAIRAGESTSYWDGSFTVPLRVDEVDATAHPVWWSLISPH